MSKTALLFADRILTELETDLGVHHDEPFLRMSRLRLMEIKSAMGALLASRPADTLTSEERKVFDCAMAWYRWTLAEGYDQTDYRYESLKQWLACKALDDASNAAGSDAK